MHRQYVAGVTFLLDVVIARERQNGHAFGATVASVEPGSLYMWPAFSALAIVFATEPVFRHPLMTDGPEVDKAPAPQPRYRDDHDGAGHAEGKCNQVRIHGATSLVNTRGGTVSNRTPEAPCTVWYSAEADGPPSSPMNIFRRRTRLALTPAVLVLVGLCAAIAQARAAASPQRIADDGPATPLEAAQRSFYNGDYGKAGALTLALCQARRDDLDACELRTASLLFQIKRALKETGVRDSDGAWSRCSACPPLMSAFLAETARAQAVARLQLKTHADDADTLFFLGKVDLNYVWLQLGTLGHKTGWTEYWEARRSLDHVLRLNPQHVRARVARGWVDYIVATTVPRGVRWLLGGGNKKRGLFAVREVVTSGGGNFFVRTEATFALWEMQVREHEVAGAVATARTLTRDFPENAELRKFLADQDPAAHSTVSGRRSP